MAASTKTVLVIVAHADDMEFMAGGTIAKMAATNPVILSPSPCVI
ncbi:unnamed protein product, partial [marine sediment metagenome]